MAKQEKKTALAPMDTENTEMTAVWQPKKNAAKMTGGQRPVANDGTTTVAAAIEDKTSAKPADQKGIYKMQVRENKKIFATMGWSALNLPAKPVVNLPVTSRPAKPTTSHSEKPVKATIKPVEQAVVIAKSTTTTTTKTMSTIVVEKAATTTTTTTSRYSVVHLPADGRLSSSASAGSSDGRDTVGYGSAADADSRAGDFDEFDPAVFRRPDGDRSLNGVQLRLLEAERRRRSGDASDIASTAGNTHADRCDALRPRPVPDPLSFADQRPRDAVYPVPRRKERPAADDGWRPDEAARERTVRAVYGNGCTVRPPPPPTARGTSAYYNEKAKTRETDRINRIVADKILRAKSTISKRRHQ